MAERRMFAKTIIDSDAFLDMPLSTQSLYFHLSMRGDDEGFVNNPKKIQRMIGASDDDMRILISKNFIIAFETGIIVIKHWKMHNYIRGDRLQPTVYAEERAVLEIKDNGTYTLISNPADTCQPNAGQLTVDCQSDVSQMSAQDSIGKDSIGKVSIGKERTNAHALASDFDKLWNIYPKKKGKKTAFTAYERAIKKGVSNDVIEKAIYAFIADCKRNNTADRYIPYGGTWFNQERWNDSYESTGINAVDNYDGGENILDELGDF